MNFKQKMARLAVVSAVAGVASSAHAAAGDLDISAVATAISGSIVPITTIGSGVLLVIVTLKVFGWVRSAIR